MNKFLLILYLNLSISLAFGQALLQRTLTNEIKFAISDGVRYDDGSWIFSAFAYSFTPGDSAMAIVMKTDSSFSPLWAKRYKTYRRDDFSCITPLMDGNVLVGGTMRQDFALELGGSVYKLDTAGNVIWHLMYEEDFDDRVLDIFEQADSTLMIFIREGVTNKPTKIIHATKDGAIINQRTYAFDTTFGLLANSVISDENEQYYFSGTVFLQGKSELFICSVDDTNLLWYKRFTFGDRSVGSFSSAYKPADQTIMLGGTITDTVGIFVNIWLAKMDLQGNVIWMKEYGRDGGYTENVSAIKPLANGDIMMYGRVFDDQGSEGFAMKLDAMGNQMWTKGYAPTSPSIGIGDVFFLPDGRSLMNANDGEQVFLISTDSNGTAICNMSEVAFNVAELSAADSTYMLSVGNPGVQVMSPLIDVYDVVIGDSLVCEGTVGIEDYDIRQLKVYPNPAHDQLLVVLPEDAAHTYTCLIMDAFGRKLIPDTTRNSSTIQIDLSDMSVGMYWIVLEIDGKMFVEQFVRR